MDVPHAKGPAANVARGAVMGLADVIPGVSGGTMALLLGIYERFIHALAAVDAKVAKRLLAIHRRQGRQDFLAHARETDLWFLVQIGAGILVAILAGAHLIGALIEGYPVVMMALFFGLILASARIPWRRIAVRRPRHLVAGFVGIAVAAATVLLPATSFTPGLPFIAFAGMLAITAMLLPGISGSALLVLLGVYPVVLLAVQELDVLVLAVFALGAVVGLLAASRGIKWLLARWHDTTMAALAGLMVGSLARVWPWRTEPGFGMGGPVLPVTSELLWPLLYLIAGAVLSIGIEWLGARPARRNGSTA